VGEVAGGLVGSETVLGIVPGGTGNDLCAELGLPANPLAAARLALTAQRTRAVDLGEVRTHGRGVVFANVAGLGFDAAAVRRVRATPHLGLVGGSLSYVIGALRALRGFHPRPLRLALDGQPLERTVFLAAVAITRRYAGGIRIAPHAILDDGLFDVCLVGDLRPAEVLRVLPRLYRGGHCRHPQVEFFRCRELRAESVGPARVGWHADGEPLGELPAVFRVRPERLRYVVGELPARFSRGRRGSQPQPPSASARGPTVR
jgi:diacylglycerol kinase (ATP)